MQLKRNHTYYYQEYDTTLQYYIIIINNAHTLYRFKHSCTVFEYFDFIICTEKDAHVERIAVDSQFINNTLPKAKSLFDNSILPQLLG